MAGGSKSPSFIFCLLLCCGRFGGRIIFWQILDIWMQILILAVRHCCILFFHLFIEQLLLLIEVLFFFLNRPVQVLLLLLDIKFIKLSLLLLIWDEHFLLSHVFWLFTWIFFFFSIYFLILLLDFLDLLISQNHISSFLEPLVITGIGRLLGGRYLHLVV